MRAANRTPICRSALIGAIAMGAAGCAGIERFAPPGIVKYEDLAKGQPMNERIKARVVEANTAEPARYPNLSQAPQAAPETLSAEEQAALEAALKEMRAALGSATAAVTVSLGEGDDAGAEALMAVRDALKAKVEADDAAARTERGLPPRRPRAE